MCAVHEYIYTYELEFWTEEIMTVEYLVRFELNGPELFKILKIEFYQEIKSDLKQFQI